MSEDNQIIVAEKPVLPPFAIAPAALQLRDNALAGSALIGKVENKEQNEAAVAAHAALDKIAKSFRKERERLNQPFLQASRDLMKAVETELIEVDQEIGRVANLRRDFRLAEERRIREEQELQRRELARIEAEKQAELTRIAVAQAEAERQAREAAAAAARLAQEATNKKQREAAVAAKAESDRLAAIATEQAKAAAAKTQMITEAAQVASFAESKPIVATRAPGESNRTDWEIVVVNPYELAKFHPDCVRIEPLLTPIKSALNAGITVKGVRAEKKFTAGVRQFPGRPAIDV